MKTGSIESQRRRQAAALLQEPGPDQPSLDALLIGSLTNIRYLTGFTGSHAWLLLGRDSSATLFTDPRYTVQSRQQVNCRIRIAKGPLTKSVLQVVAHSGVKRIGFEQDRLTVAEFEVLKKDLPSRAELVPVAGLIEQLRIVKDEGEIALIRKSVLINSRALESALKHLKRGMSEADLATEIDYRSRRLGADGPSFDTIVAAGQRAALPHAHPGAARIDTGMLLIDMGAFHAGYASDMTRMAYLGRPDAEYKRVYAAVLEAQKAALDAIREGVTTSAVDRAARQTLKARGLEREFVHSTGHGLGLEIHEVPRIGRKDKTKLRAGMAITIEPGVYIEGWGGIRIEDTVLVTANGCEILTPTSKELRQL